MSAVELGAPLPIGSTIGILGGGQLGRMLALAAAPLGYRCHIFAPEAESVAAEVAASWTQAAFEDQEALARFVEKVDVITTEWENVPAAAVAFLAARKPCYPKAKTLALAQDRVAEKSFAARLGVATAPWCAIDSLQALQQGVASLGAQSLLKTQRFGYDGKGQQPITPTSDLASLWQAFGERPAILEARLAFQAELSVLVVCGAQGQLACYAPVRNVHRQGILHSSHVPADLAEAITSKALAAASHLARALDERGVYAFEFFVMPDGALLFNEMAPRVHNSGHWTIEGAVCSQFENHIRAICGLPLGDTRSIGRVRMENLLGDASLQAHHVLGEADAHVHLYGKSKAHSGRKMGHITWVTRWVKA